MSSTLASGDISQASTYGEVFVEISTETMQEVECQGVKCYVACSCNTDEGWFDTPAGARNGDTNAEVWTITSKKHKSMSSVSTSSVGDVTISTMSTNANQTPITTASTRSMFSAPSLSVTSATDTMATCYKKKTCGDMDYYDEEPSKNYFTSEKSTNECYKVTGCNTDGGAYTTSPNTDFFTISSKTSEKNIETTCYRATGCATGKVSVNPLQASSLIPAMSNYFDIEVSVASGVICVGDNGCNTEKGASTTSPDNTVFNVYEGTIETTCYKATSCKTSNYWVEEADKPNETIFSIVSKPYPSPDSRRCYKANGCQCGILPGDLSSFGLEYEVSGSTKCTLINNSQITALVNQCNSITNNKEAYSGCLGMKAALDSMNKNTGTTQKSVCQNACVTTSTNNANINQNTYINTCYGICTYACGSDSDTCPTGYYDIDPDDYGSLVFSTGITLPSGKECFQPTGCNELKGYYADADDVDPIYFSRTSTTNLGKTCYYAVGCNTENMATTDCYTATNAITHISGNVQCTESIYHLCSTSYYHYYEEDLAGSVISRAFDYTPQTINGKTCYHADGCKTGYTPDETKRKEGGSCYTYGQLTCYEADTECPSGYFSTEAECKTEGANYGFYSYNFTCTYDSSSSCYGLDKCPKEYTLQRADTSIFEYTSASTTLGGSTCYQATGCKGSYKPANSVNCKTGTLVSDPQSYACCLEDVTPYYLNLFVNGSQNGGLYSFTTTYTVTTQDGRGDANWTVDLSNANVDFSCNGSYPPTQYRNITFNHNASSSASTNTISNYQCNGAIKIEAIGIPGKTLYNGTSGETVGMYVNTLGAYDLHVTLNYNSYDPCGQTPGYFGNKAGCEATITNPNTQVCSLVQLGNYSCYKVVDSCNTSNGYYSTLSKCEAANAESYTTTCVYSNGCYVMATCPSGYYSKNPDSVRSYINIQSSNNTSPRGGTCYRGTSCNQGLTPNYGSTEDYYLNFIYPGMNYYCSAEHKGNAACEAQLSNDLTACEEYNYNHNNCVTHNNSYSCRDLNTCYGASYADYYQCLGYSYQACTNACLRDEIAFDGGNCTTGTCEEVARLACDDDC